MNPRTRRNLALFAAALALGLLIAASWTLPPSPELLLPAGLFLVWITLGLLFTAPLPVGLSLAPLGAVTAVLVVGAVPAGWIVFLSAWLHALLRHYLTLDGKSRPAARMQIGLAAANAAVQTFSLLAAASIYQLSGGHTPLTGLSWNGLLQLVLLVLLFYSAYLALGGVYFALHGPEHLRLYRRSARLLAYQEIPALFLAPTFALLYTHLGALHFTLLEAAFLWAAWIAFSFSSKRQPLSTPRSVRFQPADLADPQRRAEALETAFSTMRQGVLLLDLEQRTLLVNPAYEALVGSLTNSPKVGLDGEESLASGSGYTAENLAQDCRELLEGRFDLVLEVLSLPERPEVYVERTLVPVYSGSQQIGGWLVSLRDVTAEHARAEQREELANLLIHDLRSPLTTLKSGLYLIAESVQDGNPDAVRRLVSVAVRSTDRVLGLVNDLLDIYLFEGGQLPVKKRPLDLGRALKECLAPYEAVATRRKMEVRVEIEPGLPRAQVDHTAFQRVIGNLLDNAFKFTPDGGRVWLWCRSDTDRAGAAFLIGVSDTGPGISSSDQTRLFQKFQRVGESRARQDGSGLGLAYCKLAVEAHGGQIWVESAPGEGSSFIVRLPC